MGLKLCYPETDAWHSGHLATTSLRLKLNISTMFTYLQARHGDLETAAFWTPLFARGVQNSVTSIETKEGNIRFNRNGSSNFSAQEWVQTIKMLAGKTETRMRFQICLWVQSYISACFLQPFTKLITFPTNATTLTWKSCDSSAHVVQVFQTSCKTLNPLTPNDHYSGRTAPQTSKHCILYIYSTNIGTEYFKHGIYSPFFSLQNAVCFIIITYLVPVLLTFYIQGVLKLKQNESGVKRLINKTCSILMVLNIKNCT